MIAEASEATCPLIEFEGVSHSFPGAGNGEPVEALRDVSLRIATGDFVSVLGPSGCGKTTILMLAAGLLEATKGRINIAGTSPDAARAGRSFGIVFQDPVLLPWRTVRENVALPGEILRDDTVKSRSTELLGLVGLGDRFDAYPHELSGGMRSRVAIARALTLQPRILLMDEPFADLDEINRLRMNIELLRIVRQTGMTVLFVTHSVTEAAFLSDRILVLSNRPASVRAQRDVGLPRANRENSLDSPEHRALTAELREMLLVPETGGGDGFRTRPTTRFGPHAGAAIGDVGPFGRTGGNS